MEGFDGCVTPKGFPMIQSLCGADTNQQTGLSGLFISSERNHWICEIRHGGIATPGEGHPARLFGFLALTALSYRREDIHVLMIDRGNGDYILEGSPVD